VRSDDKDSTNTNKKVDEYVFVLKDKIVKQVLVKTGIQDDKNIIVTSGLKKGDEVVSRPFDAISKTLKDGSQVEKVDKSKL
jgi:HlyD family secretion protein